MLVEGKINVVNVINVMYPWPYLSSLGTLVP